MPPDIGFERLAEAHLTLLHGWLQAPHVRAFWDDGERTLEQVRAHYFEDREVKAFVFTLDSQPAGYIQAYSVPPGAEFGAWRAATGETWGIDLYIGAAHLLGRGQARSIILAFVERLQTRHPRLRRVLIDPETHNARAIHVYGKAGFSPLDQIQHGGKQLQIMALDLP